MNPLEVIKSKIKDKKHIIVSIDLDDTLVNRSKGDNYVRGDNLLILKRILEKKNITVVINTGRERYCYEAFCDVNAITTGNAILGSGSVIEVNGLRFFDEQSVIEKTLIQTITDLIEK